LTKNGSKKRYELWYEFLNTATNGDKEFIRYLQKIIGYSLTGDTREEKIFFIYGGTSTGKSTFLEAIKATLGDYAGSTYFQTFLKKSQDNDRTRQDIARLYGSRFVTAIEADAHSKLSEETVKSLTGGDTILARFLYQKSFEYKPQYKIWLAANDAPHVSHRDEAIWRRMIRIPFDRQIPEKDVDPNVKADLTAPEKAGATILHWAVEGCLMWQKHGLKKVPKVIKASTEKYREETDPVKDFLEDRCILKENKITTVKDLRRAYTLYCHTRDIKFLLGEREFNKQLETKGLQQSRKRISGHLQRVWLGISLRPNRKFRKARNKLKKGITKGKGVAGVKSKKV
jgi:putative DNA primase/helicase